MLEIMAEASRELLDGFELRAKAEMHTRYDDEAGHELWFKILKILDDCQ
jgi:hypothetical protein